MLQLFEFRGISRRRILARGFESRPNDHFLTFHDIDICLDSVPYNGTTTTFDSLWMGVPVVTMTGDLHVTRTSTSILNEMGLGDWIADTPRDFIALCTQKATNRSALASLRLTMHDRMRSSTLGDSARFSAHFDRLLRRLWQDLCRNPPAYLAVDSKNAPEDEHISVFHGGQRASISIVVCAASRKNLVIHRRHIRETIGVDWQYIGIDNASAGFGLAEAYNRGASLATADVLLFMHDDVYVATPHWGAILTDKFRLDPELGLVGLA